MRNLCQARALIGSVLFHSAFYNYHLQCGRSLKIITISSFLYVHTCMGVKTKAASKTL